MWGWFSKKKEVEPIQYLKNYVSQQLPFICDHYSDKAYHIISSDLYHSLLWQCSKRIIRRCYKKEIYDCENFARHFQSELQYEASKDSLNLPIAEIKYKKDKGGWHGINLILLTEGYIFVEPQTCEALWLSVTEKNSISHGGYCRF